MTQAAEYPFDLKSIISDCILALLWRKDDIIRFFGDCGVQASELEVVRGNKTLKRHQVVQDVFQRLSLRSDRGHSAFEQMLTRFSQWNYFDPFWFDKQQKLDRSHAEGRLAELRRMISARHAAESSQQQAKKTSEKAREDSKGLQSLREEFETLATGTMKPQERGRKFEGFLRRLFGHFDIPMSKPFSVVGEEIDGSFKFEGENYIVEAKWHDASIATEALYKFAFKADGKMYGRGLFISVNAYSWQSIKALVDGKVIKTMLMDGEDLMLILNGQVTLGQAIDRKIQAAQLRGEVYVHPVTMESKGKRFRQ